MSNVPKTMRASVLKKVGVIEIEERPVPAPKKNEVLIKVAAVGVCGSDIHYYTHGKIGPYVVESPLILGHECSGTIVAVGEGVNPSRIGERVAIEPQKPCRNCNYCMTGRYNLCPKMEFYATPPIDGAFCEYVIIENDFAFKVPDNMSDEAAALLEPLSVGIAAAEKANLRQGQTVLIAGSGPIGVIAAQVCRAYGARDVVVTDLNEERRKLALKFGATRVFDPRDKEFAGVTADVFIDATGATPAVTDGISRTNPGGTVVLVGSADVIPVSVPEIAMREVVVTGTFRYTGTWPIAISMYERGAIQLDSLVTDKYGLDQVAEALNATPSPATLKRIVYPGVAKI